MQTNENWIDLLLPEKKNRASFDIELRFFNRRTIQVYTKLHMYNLERLYSRKNTNYLSQVKNKLC